MLYALALRAILTFKGSRKFSRALNLRTLLPCELHHPPAPPPRLHPPRCSFSRCSSSVSKALLRSSSLTILPNHQLGGVQSVLMLSQQLPKCNNYSFFFFSSNVRWQSGVGREGWWWKRGSTVRVREYLAIWQRKRTHTEAWDKSKWFLKTLLWVSRDAALIFTFSFSLFVRRGPEYFSSLMDASAVTLPWLYYRTPSYLWPERGRRAAAFSLAQQTEALLVNEAEKSGSVDGCLCSAGAYCNGSP